MRNTKIIQEALSFERIIAELEENSKYYPDILIKNYYGTLYASTLARIKRNKIYYVVHCVEAIIITPTTSEKDLLLKIMKSVHNIIYLYKLTGKYENIDILQISETERLKTLNK